MKHANIIYDTILSITGDTKNIRFNQEIFDVFCKVIETNQYKNSDITQKIATYTFEMERNDDISRQIFDNLYNRLHKVKNKEFVLNSELTKSIKNAIENDDISRHKIMRQTHNPEYQFDEEEILFFSHPQTITLQLRKLGLNKEDEHTLKNTQKNGNTKISYQLKGYTIDDLGEKNQEKYYKIFNINNKGTVEPRIFFLAIDKKDKRKITYHAYDPDDQNYKKIVKEILQENFLFSIRSDIG